MVNKLYLVTPRGFCAGVEMAIKAVVSSSNRGTITSKNTSMLINAATGC